MGGGMRCGTRSAGDDYAGRHVDGDAEGSVAGNEGRGGADSALTEPALDKQKVRERILAIGIVPVVRASSAAEARMAAEAVCEGGIPIVEIKMTVPGAVEVIRELTKSAGSGILVGAGTVLNAEMARSCVGAGAEFLVSPGFDRGMVEFAGREGKVVMAGALEPTEGLTAGEAGADFVKIFPCGQVGGAKYIKALRGPLPQIPLVPTGGVNLETEGGFIAAGGGATGGGGGCG